jgi:predicted GNAT superfamily acetyltransferase
MSRAGQKPSIIIRDLEGLEDFQKVRTAEKEVWGLPDSDGTPLTLMVASKAAGHIWIGAFDGNELAGFAFGFLGMNQGTLTVHSHKLAVRAPYRDLDLGYKLKLAQRERTLAFGIQEITWTFDPLQSKNAHLNFNKLGVVSDSYRVDFYGQQTSSPLHRNGTDRLWVRWPLASRRVVSRLKGKENRSATLEVLSRLAPLVQFSGDSKPLRSNLAEALGRQRAAIEIPGDIAVMEQKDIGLAHEWRLATRWAFTEVLKAGFFVAEFCRSWRGQQGPGIYLLEKGTVQEYVHQTP